MKLISSENAAYLAGLVDGEGSITLGRKNATAFRYPIVSIASTSIELLLWCKQKTGLGCITTKRLYRAHHKKSYHWVVAYAQAVEVLEMIILFLQEREKLRRAQLIVRLWPKITLRNGKYTLQQRDRKIMFEKEFFKNSKKV
jgi:hypothetical protein